MTTTPPDRFPQFDPLRNQLRFVTVAALVLIAASYAWGMQHDSKALIAFALPPLLMAVLVLVKWRVANLTAGVLALIWFSHGVMLAMVQREHIYWSLAIVMFSVIVIFSVSWVGLKVRKAKRSR